MTTKIKNALQACADWGLIPTEFRQCMTWEEQVLWLSKFLNNTVIPAVNEDIEKVEELENWFNNLDLQEEVDKKIDEMIDAGTLYQMLDYDSSTQTLSLTFERSN